MVFDHKRLDPSTLLVQLHKTIHNLFKEPTKPMFVSLISMEYFGSFSPRYVSLYKPTWVWVEKETKLSLLGLKFKLLTCSYIK